MLGRRSLPQLFRTAQAAKDLDEMIRLGTAIAQGRQKKDAGILRALARTLSELGRHQAALKYWTALRDLDPADGEAAFRIAEAAVAAGDRAAEAVVSATPHGNERLRLHLMSVLETPFAADPDLHHVAICGVSFCGSTLLDRILGGLPGARSIGESHWLVKEHDGTEYVPMDLSKERTGQGPFCTVCGRWCKFLNMEFRTSLAVDPSRWYQKIGARLHTSLLISADKNLSKLVDLDPLLRMSALIVFKSPAQAWASKLAKLPRNQDRRYYGRELQIYLEVWTRTYRAFLDEFRPAGDKAFLFFDDFSRDPMPGLEAICAALNLPYDPSVLHKTSPGHAIGGRTSTMAQLRAADYAVAVTPLPDPVVPDGHLQVIAGDRPTQECFRDLMSRYRELYPR